MRDGLGGRRVITERKDARSSPCEGKWTEICFVVVIVLGVVKLLFSITYISLLNLNDFRLHKKCVFY